MNDQKLVSYIEAPARLTVAKKCYTLLLFSPIV